MIGDPGLPMSGRRSIELMRSPGHLPVQSPISFSPIRRRGGTGGTGLLPAVRVRMALIALMAMCSTIARVIDMETGG
jgi:hypothetical protein